VKVGVYVDVANLAMNGGFGMRYEVLRAFACRDSAEAVRLNAYVSYDATRAQTDSDYKLGQFRFHSALRDVGYKVIQKETKWYTDETGARLGKANVDLDLAVDALLQSATLDRIVLATGDGDFVQVVKALQNRGGRVEVIGFDNVSADLRREADLYISGYLIPGLLPIVRNGVQQKWGDVNGFARGVFYAHDSTKGFGWLRYLTTVEAQLWRTDTRDPESPYRTVFCHDSELPHSLDASVLPNRNMLFEFKIAEGAEAGKTKAIEVQPIKART
jgi:uncharacterized LabA/DUF88 family protein